MSRSKEAFMEQLRAEECVRDAAPEMLEALDRILSHPKFHACECGQPNCATFIARAAIAKATGAA